MNTPRSGGMDRSAPTPGRRVMNAASRLRRTTMDTEDNALINLATSGNRMVADAPMNVPRPTGPVRQAAIRVTTTVVRKATWIFGA